MGNQDGLYADDVEVGQEWTSAGRTVTEAHVVAFAGLSADFHPLHTDEEYAKKTMFGGRIAHGPLVVAIASGLWVESPKMQPLALLNMNCKFVAPTRMGDTLKVISKLTEKKETSKGDRAVLFHERNIVNQSGETVAVVETVTLVARRPSGTV